MRLREIIAVNEAALTFDLYEEALKKIDWYFEYADHSRGKRAMLRLENMAWELYNQQPSRTIKLWNTYCPWSKNLTEDTKPDFIARLEIERTKTEKVK